MKKIKNKPVLLQQTLRWPQKRNNVYMLTGGKRGQIILVLSAISKNRLW